MNKTTRAGWMDKRCLWGSVALLIALFCLLVWAAAPAQSPTTNTTVTKTSSTEQPTSIQTTAKHETNNSTNSKATTKTDSIQDASTKKSTSTTKSSSPAANESTTASQAHPASYTWTCGKDYGGIAPADGSLSEWAPHYYIAHSYGPYGEIILSLEPGDSIKINGDSVTVEGSVVMSLGCAYEDVMSTVGWDATVFQTCIPNSNDCRFVYARGASSTEEAARAAREWAGLGNTKTTEHKSYKQEPFASYTLNDRIATEAQSNAHVDVPNEEMPTEPMQSFSGESEPEADFHSTPEPAPDFSGEPQFGMQNDLPAPEGPM